MIVDQNVGVDLVEFVFFFCFLNGEVGDLVYYVECCVWSEMGEFFWYENLVCCVVLGGGCCVLLF